MQIARGLLVAILTIAACAGASSAGGGWIDSEAGHRFAPLEAPDVTDGERSRLAAGETVIRDLPPDDGAGVGVLLMGLVDAEPALLWSVLADCERQEEFIPRVLSAEVRDRAGDEHSCELVIDMPFSMEDERTASRHHVRRLPDGGYQRRWDLLPGEWVYLRNSGSWSVHPWDGGDRSLLVNRVSLVPRIAVPNWIVSAVHRRQAPATFDAIRRRVREAAAAPRDPATLR
jgi:hypothetical protein